MDGNYMNTFCRDGRGGQAGGFTLIELMIAVVIIAVLSAIAFPSYTQHVKKSHRVDAKNALLDLAAREERYYATNNFYADKLTDLGYSVANGAPVNGTAANSYYTVSVNLLGGDKTTFQLTAVPTTLGNQGTDVCGTYYLDSTGLQTNKSAGGVVITGQSCW